MSIKYIIDNADNSFATQSINGTVSVGNLTIRDIQSTSGLTNYVVVDSNGDTFYQVGGGGGGGGTSGTSGVSGTSGTSGVSGTSGTSGTSSPGTPGTSGTSGTSSPGTPGTSGTSGTSGPSGPAGSDGPLSGSASDPTGLYTGTYNGQLYFGGDGSIWTWDSVTSTWTSTTSLSGTSGTSGTSPSPLALTADDIAALWGLPACVNGTWQLSYDYNMETKCYTLKVCCVSNPQEGGGGGFGNP